MEQLEYRDMSGKTVALELPQAQKPGSHCAQDYCRSFLPSAETLFLTPDTKALHLALSRTCRKAETLLPFPYTEPDCDTSCRSLRLS